MFGPEEIPSACLGLCRLRAKMILGMHVEILSECVCDLEVCLNRVEF